MRLLSPWGGVGFLANQAPDLIAFQVLHNKTNSTDKKAELQFAPRSMIISV